MTNTNNQVTIEDILTHCEVSKKAIIVVAELTFFLQTQDDRVRFLNQYENRLIWKEAKETLVLMRLAKEIGSYHYIYSSFDDLLKMNLRDALQHLFLQPINVGMERRYIESKATLKDMYDLKQANPRLLLMNAI